MQQLKAYILCRFAERSGIYKPWMANCPFPCEIITECPPEWRAPDDAGIVISHMHYRWEEVNALRRTYEAGRVPVLVLADGILEYRNIWEHPRLAAGCIFQPIAGHKLATIGHGQSAVIESWGNVGKCETVGLPRLDPVRNYESKPIQKEGPFRIMIATANRPAFNDEQRAAVLESLVHLRDRLANNQKVNGRPVEVTWRLTDGLDEEIGVADPDAPRPFFLKAIEDVDAVITTPSTMYLESILKHRPTAILDFHNTPHYVNSPWMINAPKHVNEILRELADPPASKMLFQESVLNYQLRCDGKATQRMNQLIYLMVEEGALAREQNREIRLPHRVIDDSKCGFSTVPIGYPLKDQYPNNTVFLNQDVERLQQELNLAITRLGTLPEELNDRITQFEESREEQLARIAELTEQNQQLLAVNNELRERNQVSNARMAELMTRCSELRKSLNRLLLKLGLDQPSSDSELNSSDDHSESDDTIANVESSESKIDSPSPQE